jgi:hypothetical protein
LHNSRLAKNKKYYSKIMENTKISSESQIRDNFAKTFVKIQEDWPKLSPDKRLDVLREALRKSLIDAGFPADSIPEVKLGTSKDFESGSAIGGYNGTENTMYLNPNLLTQSSISGGIGDVIATTLIHEREHVIQTKKVASLIAEYLGQKGLPVTAKSISEFSRVALNLKEGGVTVSTIVNSIPLAIAQVAVRDYNQGIRLDKAQTKEALTLWESMYKPEGVLSREKLNTENITTANAINIAQKKYDEAARLLNQAKAQNASVQTLQKLQQNLKSARTQLDAANAARKSFLTRYFERPEEAQARGKEAPLLQKLNEVRSRNTKKAQNSDSEATSNLYASLSDEYTKYSELQANPSTELQNEPSAERSIAAQRYDAIAKLLKESGMQEGSADWNQAVIQVAINTDLDLAEVKDIAMEIPGIAPSRAEQLLNSFDKSAQRELA